MERHRLGAWNAFLATREHGRQVRRDVENELAKMPPGTTLILDFSGVDGITTSFGDELLAKLVASGGAGHESGCSIVVEGASDDVWETLETALARRQVAVPAMRSRSRGFSVGRDPISYVIHAASASGRSAPT
jgi:STAS-like domain of unknown function (DUF4325)